MIARTLHTLWQAVRIQRRSDPESREWRLDATRTVWLVIALSLVILPHIALAPLWTSACYLLFAAWRLAHALTGTKLPPSWLVAVLGIAAAAGVVASYGTMLGRAAGVALLIVLAGMKIIESRNVRDVQVCFMLGFFLIITHFLESQEIATGLFMMVVVIIIAAQLAITTDADRLLGPLQRLRLSLRIVLQAVPLMVILFVLFPRLPTPLWGLPKDAFSSVTGVSDRMSPGSISQLTLSDAVAFRAQFDGEQPPSRSLYWRGPVLWHTNGEEWTVGTPGRSGRPVFTVPGQTSYEYEITLEPHRNRWLFALDFPSSVPPDALMTEDGQIRAVRAVTQRTRYRLRSSPDGWLRQLSLEQRGASLALPVDAHPRARALAQRWRTEALREADPQRASNSPLSLSEAVAKRALEYFNYESFSYTLTPPRLLNDSVDEFLFGTKRGFCEHYAAAFTVLMRAAGIPARVVTGYQGGEFNDVGDYWIVRQRDAHAWSEIWLEGHGWTRYDPTAAVAPNRIERGMDAALPRRTVRDSFGLAASGVLNNLWNATRKGWDALNLTWSQWVLSYGSSRQRTLLARFGIDGKDLGNLVWLMTGAIVSCVVILLLLGNRARRRVNPVQATYERFCSYLAKRGLARRPSEGPEDFALRARRAFPELRQQIDTATRLYAEIRYGNQQEKLSQFRREVRNLAKPRASVGKQAEPL